MLAHLAKHALLTSIVTAAVPAQNLWRHVPREQPTTSYMRVPQAVGDINGDGYPDFLGLSGVYLWCVRSQVPTGFGSEYLLFMHPNNGAVARVVLADVDLDGDLDMLLLRGNTGATPGNPLDVNAMLINDGTGQFTEETAQRWPTGAWPTLDAIVTDVNNDGLPDIVECNWDRHRLYLGQPGGTFVDVTATHMPLRYYGSQVAAGDLDGDGSKDLVFVAGFWGTGYDHVYINDGTGRFTDQSVRLAGRPNDTGVAIGDIDGDLDSDIVLGVSWTPGTPNRWSTVLRNDGAANFTEDPTSLGPGVLLYDSNGPVFLQDLDGDDDLDLILWGTPRQVMLNDGTGRFTDVTNAREVPYCYSTRYVHAADVDRDGDIDLVHGYNGCTWSMIGTRILQSLTQHLAAPSPPVRGQSYTVEIDGAPGGFGMLALAFGWSAIPLGPYGTLRIDPSFYLVWPSLAALGANGRGIVNVPVPNLPSLTGLHVYLQGLVTNKAAALKLTNLLHEVVQ